MRRFFLLCATLLASGATAFSYTNELEGGASQTITNGWDASDDMIVGNTTPSNTLVIVSGGSLTNVNAFVGSSIDASNNTATVSGAEAEWISTGTLQVGATGNTNNSVSVSDGGVIVASNLVIAAENDFNLNRSGTLALESGFNVSANGFNWNAGGTLSVGGVLEGLATTNEGAILSGEKNLFLNGGSLAISTNLIIGYESSDNHFAITNGGTANSANGYIGWGTNSANNSVLVSDSGSAWTNNGNLYVGVYGDATNLMTAGAGNSLTVTNDAWVFVGGEDTNLTGSVSGGIAVADGAEMVVGESSSVLTDGLYINTNSTFELNGILEVNHEFDADQTGFHWEDGATLVVHSNLTMTADLGRTNQTLNMDGGSWDRGDDLQVAGTGNTLAITNGGSVVNNAAYIVGSNNAVMVSGDGSDWLNNGTLNITNSGNSVTVDSGGRVEADSLNVTDGNDFYLNYGGTLALDSGFNVAEQSNLTWRSGGNLSVNGTVSGLTNLGGGRILTLDGSGATWDLANTNIMVGGDGVFNTRLIATNGATVTAANVQVEGFENTVHIESGSSLLIGDGAAGVGVMVASTNGAVLGIDDFSAVHISEILTIGASPSETGTVSVANGGTVTAGGLDIFDANSAFNLEDGGTLELTGDFDASLDGFFWNDGGTLSMGGTLTGFDALAGTNLTLEITAGGTWDTTATTNLFITGVNNTLAITDGVQMTNQTAYIGVSGTDWGNTVLVSGTGTVWNLTENLWVNPSNTLSLASNGLVTVDGNMTVSNATVAGSGMVQFGGGTNVFAVYGTHSEISTNVVFDGGGGLLDTVEITSNELIVAGSSTGRFIGFEYLNMTNSILGGTGTVESFTNITMSGGWIAPDGDLAIDGSFDADGTTLRVIAGTDHLSITNSGAVDLSGLLAEVSITNTTVTSAFNEEILSSADGFTVDGFTSTNLIEHFLLYDFALTNNTVETVSVVAEAAADGDIGATLAYSGIQGVRAGFYGMQNAAFVRTKQLRRNSVATDQSMSHEAFLMQTDDRPAGPQGPGHKNTIFGMHFWAEQFSGQGDYDTIGTTEGFTLNNNGTSFGFDKLVSESLVVGINYTYARSDASTTTGDKSDTETYWLGLYGEWFFKNDYYLEGLLALGWSDYETVRTEVGYTGEGTFEGSDFGAHIEGGKYFHRNNWAFAPYAALNYLGIKSDAYTETSGGNETAVDGQSVASLESSLGMKLRNRFDTQAGRFQTVGYAEWAYDFINDDIGSTLSDGTIAVGTARVAPGASVLNAGIGLSWICTDYLEVGLGYDGRFNEDYEEHMGSIMLDVRF